MERTPEENFLQLRSCACFNLRKTSRAITQYYDHLLQPTGLRSTQFSILMILKTKSGIPLMQLAQKLVMDRTTLTRNLVPLEKKNFVEIQSGNDRRQKNIFLTKTGERILKKAIPYWENGQKTIVGKMGSPSFFAFLETLTSLTEEIHAK